MLLCSTVETWDLSWLSCWMAEESEIYMYDLRRNHWHLVSCLVMTSTLLASCCAIFCFYWQFLASFNRYPIHLSLFIYSKRVSLFIQLFLNKQLYDFFFFISIRSENYGYRCEWLRLSFWCVPDYGSAVYKWIHREETIFLFFFIWAHLAVHRGPIMK